MLSQVMAETPDPPDEATRPASPDEAATPEAVRRSSTAGGAGGWVAVGIAVALLVGVVTISVAGGSGSSSGPSTCGATASEALDPNSVVQLLPNARELEYLNDPPSSGAITVGPAVAPVSPDELTRPIQVGLLARGKVLLQYQPDGLSPDDLTLLESLAGDNVVVAPNTGLKTPIVATAWRKRMTCGAMDTAALAKFATVNANRAPADLSTTTSGG